MKQTTSNYKKTKFDIRNEISQNAFNDIVEFYNNNEKSFLNIEDQFGINIWFLNHFRTYFTYRNALLKENNPKDGDSPPPQVKQSIFTTISRVIHEFALMLIKYTPPKRNKTEYVIISNSTDINNGQNKRFSGLDYDVLYNRALLDIKKKVSLKDFALGNMTSTDSIFLSYVFRLSFLFSLFKFDSHLNRLLKEISEKSTTIQNPKYRSILSFFLGKNRFYFCICYLKFKSLDRYFKKSNIKGVLLSDENSPQQKVIQYAAHRNNIRTFGFQHGNIHQLHPAYIYGRYKTKPLLPTITFTWGTYFTELLHNQGGYAANQVKTVGRIPPPINQRKQNHRINKDDNVILYASQPHRDPDIRYKLLADILNTVKELSPRYKLVVRPHPNEKDDDFFNKVANDVEFHDFIIDRETDLRTHLEICKILLVAFSTVGTEFVPYFKPLLVLDYLGQDLIKWIEEGVGIAIRNKRDLFDKLSKIRIEIDKENYQSFINKYYTVNHTVIEKIKTSINEIR